MNKAGLDSTRGSNPNGWGVTADGRKRQLEIPSRPHPMLFLPILSRKENISPRLAIPYELLDERFAVQHPFDIHHLAGISSKNVGGCGKEPSGQCNICRARLPGGPDRKNVPDTAFPCSRRLPLWDVHLWRSLAIFSAPDPGRITG